MSGSSLLRPSRHLRDLVHPCLALACALALATPAAAQRRGGGAADSIQYRYPADARL